MEEVHFCQSPECKLAILELWRLVLPVVIGGYNLYQCDLLLMVIQLQTICFIFELWKGPKPISLKSGHGKKVLTQPGLRKKFFCKLTQKGGISQSLA